MSTISTKTIYNAATGEYSQEVVDDEPVIEEPILEQQLTPEERLEKLEQGKTDQTDVKELAEALKMILSGVTE